MYMEDVDLCWRLRRLGWRVGYEPAGAVVHVQGVEHRPAPVPHDRRAPPLRVPVRGEALARRRRLLLAADGAAARACGRRRDHGRGRSARDPAAAGQRVASTRHAAVPQTLRALRDALPATASRSGAGADRSGWNVAIAVVVIVGVVAIVFTRSNDTSSAGTGPPHAADATTGQPGDHWHTYLGVNICGEWLTPGPAFEKPVGEPAGTQNAGIHSHGDGLIHTHPFVVSEEGNNATLGKYADYGGWGVSSDSIDAWTGPKACPTRRAGATATRARSASTRARRASSPGRSTARRGPATRPTTTSRTARRSRSASCPRARTLASRRTRATPFANISDQQTAAVVSKNSPCRARATTTTAPTAPTDAPTTTLARSETFRSRQLRCRAAQATPRAPQGTCASRARLWHCKTARVRVLVTGGAGFIGSALVDRLLAEGCDVDAIDDLSTGSLAQPRRRARPHRDRQVQLPPARRLRARSSTTSSRAAGPR